MCLKQTHMQSGGAVGYCKCSHVFMPEVENKCFLCLKKGMILLPLTCHWKTSCIYCFCRLCFFLQMGLIFIDFPALFLSSTLTCERYLPSVYVESAYSYPAQIQSACNVPELQTIGENKKIQKENRQRSRYSRPYCLEYGKRSTHHHHHVTLAHTHNMFTHPLTTCQKAKLVLLSFPFCFCHFLSFLLKLLVKTTRL